MRKSSYGVFMLAVMLVFCVMLEAAQADLIDDDIFHRRFNRRRNVPRVSQDVSEPDSELEWSVTPPDIGEGMKDKFLLLSIASALVLMFCALKLNERKPDPALSPVMEEQQ